MGCNIIFSPNSCRKVKKLSQGIFFSKKFKPYDITLIFLAIYYWFTCLRVQFNILHVMLEQTEPGVHIRQRDVQALLKPSPESVIYVPGMICGRQHHYCSVFCNNLLVLYISRQTGKFIFIVLSSSKLKKKTFEQNMS